MMALPPYITKAKAGHLISILKMQKNTEINKKNVGNGKSGIKSMNPIRESNPRYTTSSGVGGVGGVTPAGTPPPRD